MTVTLEMFLKELQENPGLFFVAVLTLGVMLVNGWTDAPNAIATCVTTRSLGPGTAIAMAAVFNFLGVFFMVRLNASVAFTIYGMADFGGNSADALAALCAALGAIVLWSAAAWYFGIPTSESHGLIAGISGAAVALQGGFDALRPAQWAKVLDGLLISVAAGFFLGFGIVRLVERGFGFMERRRADRFFRIGQIGAAAAAAFLHGAQDGQKFMGVFLLGVLLARGDGGAVGAAGTAGLRIPLWLMVLCAAVMALGTAMGGERIIKTVGMDMVRMTRHQGFSADLAAGACLLFSSLAGIPVSTTHTKTAAMAGVGAAKSAAAVHWQVVYHMMAAWVLTFPGCGLLGYLMARLFISLGTL